MRITSFLLSEIDVRNVFKNWIWAWGEDEHGEIEVYNGSTDFQYEMFYIKFLMKSVNITQNQRIYTKFFELTT